MTNNYRWNLYSDDFIAHEGKAHDENPPGRGSGRYPWGSGKNPHQNTSKYYSKKEYSKGKKIDFRSSDSTFQKGIRVSRMSSRLIEDIPGVRKYVSMQTSSDDKWKRMYKEYYDQAFEHTYETIKDIKISSIDSNMRILDEIINEDPKFKDLMQQTIKRGQEVMGLSDEEVPTDMKEAFMRSLGVINDGTKTYFNKMHEHGYDAIADKFGIDSGAENAVIFLRPDDDLRLILSEKIN